MENDEKPVYDQRGQRVDTQHNAGRDVNVNQRYPQREPSRQQGGDQYNAGRDVNIFERIQNVLFSPTDAQQRRNRVTMLEKVRTYWIEGYLEQSLHKAALIELGMEYKPDALEYPWEMVVQSPDRPSEPVPPGTTIADVYDQFSGELLILGSPGTGKTTMLLELTRILIRRAEADEYHPIPVVFNLSSWAVKRQRLDKWLIEELNSRYDVPKGVARAWINYNQILPLLDGLDEVRHDLREACIDAINDYKAKRAQGVTQVVVCSRIADYAVLTKKLRLQGAVLLHTLTDQQIEDALQQLGKRGERVRTVLQNLRENAHRYQDTEAEQLTRTPLLLSITTLAYQGKADEELPPPDAPPTEQQRHLFATYVDRMFKRRGKSTHYTPERTKHWLSWLARRLHENSLTVFEMERMQPWWLGGWWQRALYVLGSALFTGAGGLILGALFGLLLGLVFGLALESFIWGVPQTFASQGDGLVFGLGGWLVFGLFSGLGNGLVCGLLASLGQRTSPRRRNWHAWFAGLVGSVLTGLLWWIIAATGAGWLALAALSAIPSGPTAVILVHRGEVQPTEILRWSWQTMRARWYLGMGSGLVLGLILGLISMLFSGLGNGLQVGLIYGLFSGLVFGLFGGLTSTEVQTKPRPNAGIWRSLRHALATWLFGGLVFGLVGWLYFWLVFGLYGILYSTMFIAIFFGLFLGLGFGLGIGLGVGPATSLYFGGLAFVQHWALRLLCTITGAAPWRYARFLDYATERILLRKVGGSYIFVHRMLLEHFAGVEMANPVEQSIVVSTCTECGKPQRLTAKFCPFCGTPFKDTDRAPHRTVEIQMQRQYSRWGIVSTILGFLSTLLACVFFGWAAYTANNNIQMSNTVVAILLMAGGFINLTGLIAGLGSLFQRNRQQILSIVGLILNLLIFVPMCGFMAFAILSQGG